MRHMRQIKADSEDDAPPVLAMRTGVSHYGRSSCWKSRESDNRTTERIPCSFCGVHGHSQFRCMFQDEGGRFCLVGKSGYRDDSTVIDSESCEPTTPTYEISVGINGERWWKNYKRCSRNGHQQRPTELEGTRRIL